MANKYYAVHQGKIPGVYETWTDCQKQVKGYSGAVFKSFQTRDDAVEFVKFGKDNTIKVSKKTKKINDDVVIRQDKCEMFAYIDGSFEKELNAVGYGGVIGYNNKEIYFSKGTTDDFYAEYWNVAGELLAAQEVMNYAKEHNIKSCAIYYDYQGIEMWAIGKWKTNNPLTQSYAKFAKEIAKTVKVEFYKVAAHTGVKYNELADKLAKEGVRKV